MAFLFQCLLSALTPAPARPLLAEAGNSSSSSSLSSPINAISVVACGSNFTQLVDDCDRMPAPQCMGSFVQKHGRCYPCVWYENSDLNTEDGDSENISSTHFYFCTAETYSLSGHDCGATCPAASPAPTSR